MHFEVDHHLDPLGRRRQRRWVEAQRKRDDAKAAWFGRDPALVAADLKKLEDLLFPREVEIRSDDGEQSAFIQPSTDVAARRGFRLGRRDHPLHRYPRKISALWTG